MLRNLPKLWPESAQRRENKTARLTPGLWVLYTEQPRCPHPLLPLRLKCQDPLSIFMFSSLCALKPGFLFLSHMSRPSLLLITFRKHHHLLFLFAFK